MTRCYTLRQICEIIGIDDGFAGELVREAILIEDGPDAGGYSALMLERARVAHELVHELDVNLAGAAVIVRMREELTELHRGIRELAHELERLRRS